MSNEAELKEVMELLHELKLELVAEMDYASLELQVEAMLCLKRVMEQFAAAAMSLQHSRAFDAVCTVVPGCINAIADALLRRLAVDRPSELSAVLMGQTIDGRPLGFTGFGLSVGTFAEQTETIEVHYPELNVARTAVPLGSSPVG